MDADVGTTVRTSTVCRTPIYIQGINMVDYYLWWSVDLEGLSIGREFLLPIDPIHLMKRFILFAFLGSAEV